MITQPITQPITRRAALVTLAFGGIGLAACSRGSGTTAESDVAYYTCTMHPFVRSQDPNGKCPICGMNLVPVLKKDAAPAAGASVAMGTPAGPTEFSVPVERQQQIGVTYAAVEKERLKRTIRAVGMVEPDKSRQWNFVARVEGYVQKLEVTSPGEKVSQGQPLLTIYSPELLTAERVLVNLLNTHGERRGGNDPMIEAARERLEQWNVTPEQIAELERTRKPSQLLTLYSPYTGVVQQAPPGQGLKVMPGDSLLAVADLSVVWVWAEFYEEEGPMLARGQKVLLTARGYPGETFEGRVAVIDPFLDELSRTTRVRIDIPNADLKLRPGMYANAELTVNMGEGLTIPVSAVIPTGTRNLVFVDKGGGRLDPRFIDLGGTFDARYEVKKGLQEGERVVASGNFLIDAESQVEGAVKSFEEPGDAKSGEAQ